MRKLQIAIVGSGPSAFYLADALSKHEIIKTKFPDFHIDMLERAPVPFGLVRYGVAPDHPEVKNVVKRFTEIATSKNVTWLGNMNVGHEITVDVLKQSYDVVAFATGAAEEAKELDIPGSKHSHVHSAKSFVEWYNTSPNFREHKTPPWLLQSIEDVVIIGNGNVAMDVGRILLKDPADLATTDMCAYAVQHLWKAKIKNVSVVGRRGIRQSAFTIKEFREMLHLHNLFVSVPPFDLLPEYPTRAEKRLQELLHQTSQKAKAAPRALGQRCFALEYGLRPVEIFPNRVKFEICKEEVKTEVVNGKETTTSSWVGTGKHKEIGAQLVIHSLGYRGKKIFGLPFDEGRGCLKHDGAGRVVPGVYAAGWARNGPTGVIVNAVQDANVVANTILNDLSARGDLGEVKLGKFALIDVIHQRKIEFVTFNAGWKRIQYTEEMKGVELGKSAEKIPDNETMLSIATSGKHGYNSAMKFRGNMLPRPPELEYVEFFLDEESCLVPPDMPIRETEKTEFEKEQEQKRRLFRKNPEQ